MNAELSEGEQVIMAPELTNIRQVKMLARVLVVDSRPEVKDTPVLLVLGAGPYLQFVAEGVTASFDPLELRDGYNLLLGVEPEKPPE